MVVCTRDTTVHYHFHAHLPFDVTNGILWYMYFLQGPGIGDPGSGINPQGGSRGSSFTISGCKLAAQGGITCNRLLDEGSRVVTASLRLDTYHESARRMMADASLNCLLFEQVASNGSDAALSGRA